MPNGDSTPEARGAPVKEAKERSLNWGEKLILRAVESSESSGLKVQVEREKKVEDLTPFEQSSQLVRPIASGVVIQKGPPVDTERLAEIERGSKSLLGLLSNKNRPDEAFLTRQIARIEQLLEGADKNQRVFLGALAGEVDKELSKLQRETKKKEKPRPAEMNFKAVVECLSALERQYPNEKTAPPEAIVEKKELIAQRDGLLKKADKEGVLDDIKIDMRGMWDILKVDDDLTAKDIMAARQRAREITKTESPDDEYRGLKQHYYEEKLEELDRARRKRAVEKIEAEREGKKEEKEKQEEVGKRQEKMIETLEQSQQRVFEAVQDGLLTVADALDSSADQTGRLVDVYKGVPPEEERARWTEVECSQDFYTRFTPNVEPKFYTSLSVEERKLYDDRWQLARAAFYKKASSAFPDKMIENQDLLLLRKDQMERLYKMEGVRPALEWYAEAITNKDKEVELPDRRKMSIWKCRDETDFEMFREAMREQALSGLEEWRKREADAVAWNWMWVGNLIESVDSRYSLSGERHGNLPGAMVSDDLRAVFHVQEKFESKCANGLEWGAFGKWGITQIERVKKEVSFDGGKDEIVFERAPAPGKFWEAKRQGNTITVYAPECFPSTAMKSFWEETDVKIGRDKKTLLKLLQEKKEIPWKEVGADAWIPYLPIKLLKAVKLLEYFKPGVPLEERGVMKTEWFGPLLDAFRRLGLEEKLKGNDFHNLKVWAVHAAYGGVGKPQKKERTLPIPRADWLVLEQRLRMYQIGYLKRGMGGLTAFTGENLKII